MTQLYFHTNLLGNWLWYWSKGLRFQERLSNFFASAYSNNSKYNSSYLLYLRLLFERNNKFKSTFDKLGNVFRNSKWNDLKVQNIKNSLVNSWSATAFGFLAVLLLTFSFFGFTNNSGTIFLPAFLSELRGIFFFIIANLSNALTLSFIKAGFLILSAKLYIIRLFGFNTSFVFDTFSQTPSQSSHPVSNESSLFVSNLNYTLTHNASYSTGTLELVRNLSRSTYALARLQETHTFHRFLTTNTRQPVTMVEFLLHETLDFGYAEACAYKPQQLFRNITQYKSNFNFTNKSINLDLKTLNNLNSNSFMKNLSNLNVYTNLNQSKQNRWLLKNSLLANTSTTDLFKFTQAKNLVGNAVYDSAVTSHSVWNSSKLTQLSKTNELLNLSLFQNLNLSKESFGSSNYLNLLNSTPAHLHNFDFFEDSRLWTTKKYFFTNQLKANTLVLSNTNAQSLASRSEAATWNTWLSVLLNTKNASLGHQINSLSFSTFTRFNTTLSNKQFSTTFSAFASDLDLLRESNGAFLTSVTSTSASVNTSVYSFATSTRSTANAQNLAFHLPK